MSKSEFSGPIARSTISFHEIIVELELKERLVDTHTEIFEWIFKAAVKRGNYQRYSAREPCKQRISCDCAYA